MATSRTSGETKDAAAVPLERPRRAGDASGFLQLVEEPGHVGLGHVEWCTDERSIGLYVLGQPVEEPG
jgi:hypothetical protein